MWAAQQRRLPQWEGLSVMTNWVIEDLVKAQQARPEIPRGIRPTGTPVTPLPDPEDVGLVFAHLVVTGEPSTTREQRLARLAS